jgi:hypothetical protein
MFRRPTAQKLWLIEWTAGDSHGTNHFIAGSPPYDFKVYRRWVERAGISTTADPSRIG